MSNDVVMKGCDLGGLIWRLEHERFWKSITVKKKVRCQVANTSVNRLDRFHHRFGSPSALKQ
jgi:hypothetical protein